MIKNSLYTLLAAFLVVSMVSCEKNNVVVGKDVTPAPFVKIATWAAADTVGTYIIPEPVNGKSAPYIIPIGVTNVSNVDRTINISYSSATAVNGQQFSAPTTLVVKAGEALVNLEITGIYDGYESVSRSDNLKVTITGGDVPANVTKTNYLLTIKKYWVAPTNVFQGIYTESDYYGGELDGDPYPVEVSLISANGPLLNMQVVGLWGMSTPLKFTMSWIDLEHGTTTVPTQAWVSDLFGYGQATTKQSGNGTFTVTPNQFSLGYEHTVSAGSFGKYVSVFEK
ncbi:MAG: hypothetical protein KIT66_07005 [Chitinophagaceae bacterium]|nr:hypothetical protein [Chitinophagaceae bacterium]